MADKVCPILAGAGAVAVGAAQGAMTLQPGWDLCQGPACAWYDAARDCCAVLALARAK